MPHPDLFTLRELKPIDNDSAAAAVASETHAALLAAVVASSTQETSPHPRTKRLKRQPLLLVTALATIVAVLLIVTPGLLSGNNSATQPQSAQAAILHRIAAAMAPRPGTIVIQDETYNVWRGTGGRGKPLRSGGATTMTETSASGAQELIFGAPRFAPGFEEVTAGAVRQVYDPTTRIIYATTAAALKRLVLKRFPPATGSPYAVSFEPAIAPGRTSIFAKELRRGLYRLEGRSTIGGRQALRLVPPYANEVMMNPRTGITQRIGTVYVTPRSYAPIEEVITHNERTEIINWSLYEVLPDTRGNDRLLSLTARHPHARVVDSAAAYVAARRREGRRELARP